MPLRAALSSLGVLLILSNAFVFLAVGATRGQGVRLPSGTGQISGRLLTSSSEPIANVPLVAVLRTAVGLPVRWTTTSGADGTYQFEALPEGSYVIRVTRNPLDGLNLLTPSAPGTGVAQVDLASGGRASEVNITVLRTGKIAGHVLNANGTLAADTDILMSWADDNGITVFIVVARTDTEGRFTIDNAPAGTYFLATPGTRWPRNGEPPADHVGLAPITLAEGASLSNIEIREREPLEFTVRGRVADPLGVAPRDLTIEYGAPGASHRGLLSVSNAGGSFQIVDGQIKTGPVTLMAYGTTEQGPVVGLVTFAAIEGLNLQDITVDRPGALSGHVFVDGSNTPLTGIATRLALVREGFTPLGEGDETLEVAPDGWFEMRNLIGEYRVRVDEPRGWTATSVRRRGLRLRNDRIVVGNAETIDNLEVVIGPR